MAKAVDLTGKRFNRWTVLKYTHQNKHKKKCYDCLCECGKIGNVVGSNLVTGASKSCGCLSREKMVSSHTTHGKAYSREYKTWGGMMSRCNNPNVPHYERYGGRGIKVCKRWHKFVNFFADMGERPKGKTLDRIDNNKSYCKSNCRWATQSEQCHNRHYDRRITIGNLSLTRKQVLEEHIKEKGIVL